VTVKKSYEISIFNQKFVIKSDADERYVQKVADYLNKKMHEIVSNTKSVSSLRVALLAALNVADDFFKLRDRRKETCSLAEEKVKSLISLIDTQLG
jgi:cell division protein ZapA